MFVCLILSIFILPLVSIYIEIHVGIEKGTNIYIPPKQKQHQHSI